MHMINFDQCVQKIKKCNIHERVELDEWLH
jgi:hypothetical protein